MSEISNRMATRLESWLRPGLDPRYVASAVLAVMRTPTAEMLQAGADVLPDMDRAVESYAVAIDDAGTVWEAMIDAALKT